ncbi:hypothetical protein PO870_19360 [Rhizobium sp. MJ37]|nr:hypothetical protein [Rhizobium sp. MJ37]MDC9835545.1 hypothetical protein [Rhizobium sp. MJ37]
MGGKRFGAEGADIGEDWNRWPMLLEDCLTEGANFTKCDGFKTDTFKAEAKATDARE